MANEQVINLVVQFGSFGVLVVIILWVGRVLVPNALAAFERQGERFEKMQERQDLRHESQLAKRDAQLEKLTETIGALADRVEKVEEQTKEHKPLKD